VRKTFLIPLMIVLVIGLIFTGCAAPAPGPSPAPAPAPSPAPAPVQKIVLKGVTHLPVNHPENRMVHWFVERVNTTGKGEIEIDWIGGPEVFAGFDQPEAIRSGAVDIVMQLPHGYCTELVPVAAAEALSQWTFWEERENGVFDAWDEIFQKQMNSKYLGRPHCLHTFNLYLNKKIAKVEDLKGLNIRVQPLYIPFIEALGAAPLTIAAPDMYTALERGTVDGVMWPQAGITGFALEEVVKYEILPGVMQVEPLIVMNLDKWNSLPKHLQDFMLDTAYLMSFVGTSFWRENIEREWEKMEAAGMERINLPPQEGKKLVEIAYDKTWEKVLQDAPEDGAKMKKLLTRKK